METQSLAPSPTALAAAPAAGALAGAASLLLGGAGGGLQGVGAVLAQAGCGAQFDSLVGTGPNLPISGGEIRRALDASVLAIARSTQRSPERVADALAELLPRLVDALTPAGRLSAAGRLGTLWALAKLFWRGRRGAQ